MTTSVDVDMDGMNDRLVEAYIRAMPEKQCCSMHVPELMYIPILETVPLYAFNNPIITVLNH